MTTWPALAQHWGNNKSNVIKNILYMNHKNLKTIALHVKHVEHFITKITKVCSNVNFPPYNSNNNYNHCSQHSRHGYRDCIRFLNKTSEIIYTVGLHKHTRFQMKKNQIIRQSIFNLGVYVFDSGIPFNAILNMHTITWEYHNENIGEKFEFMWCVPAESLYKQIWMLLYILCYYI